MDDLLSEFLTETFDSLDVVDNELVRFESEPNNRTILDNIFRLVHTIKGTCGFLGLPRLEAVAHAGETLLGRFRDGGLEVTPAAVTLVLHSIDRIKELLNHLETEGVEPSGDDNDLIKPLEDAAEGKPIAGATPAASVSAEDTAQDTADAEADAPAEDAPAQAEGAQDDSAPAGDKGENWDEDLNRPLRPGEVSLADLEAAFQNAEFDPDYSPDDDAPKAEDAQIAEGEPEADAAAEPAATQAQDTPAVEASADAEPQNPTVEAAVAEKPATPAAPPAAAGGASAAEGASGAPLTSQSLRVNVDVLENLMTMVSELVLTRNQLMQMVRGQENTEFKVPLQRLSNITAELQDGVMKTRMQPIGNAWKKLPRIVRDVAQDLGKKINLVMEGEDTELDRQVLELIKDPLTHMVRNSCDHGIETPDTRTMVGKPEAGRLTLRAYHEGGHIIIQISDDGAGLNVERIRRKAAEKGLMSEEEAAAMSEAQVQRLIFHPGFSTAAKVTNLSGRGVGMDVVRTNIEQIGGAIDVSSVEGRGASFTIKIPLTLAIISALIVGAGESRFAIPQLAVVELVRVGPRSENSVEFINETRVMRLRDRLLPLIDLAGTLNMSPQTEADAQTDQEAARFVVVMQVGGQRFGVVVDQVFDTEEIVVKPLASALSESSQFSGNTILGDGSVIMIIDPNGLATEARATSDEMEREDGSGVSEVSRQDGESAVSMLIFRSGGPEPKAAPLSLVTRLEEIDPGAVEEVNGRYLVQYRGQLMPVVPLSPMGSLVQDGRQPMLVFTDGDNSAGLLVDEIVDVVDEVLNIELAGDDPGVTGTAVLSGRATEIVDISHHLTRVSPDWFERKVVTQQTPKKLLLVDDNAFFRHVMRPLVAAAGYDVTTVESAKEAWVLQEQGAEFDVIVTDIDMPEVDGVTFANQLRDDKHWGHIPRLALSALDASAITQEMDDVFDGVVRKTDRNSLVAALNYTLKQLGEAA